jgi:hypothetical protein
MPGGPFPPRWLDAQVAVEVAGGSQFVGRVTDPNEGGCIIVREVPEGDNPEPVTRRYCYPWTSIRSISSVGVGHQSSPFPPGPPHRAYQRRILASLAASSHYSRQDEHGKRTL